MTFIKNKEFLAFAGIAIAMFLCVIFFRPLIPIDETRYMSVAWEMWLRQDWLAPLTKNFEPYHHKPPLLFWLINGFWEVFGVSRWAGTIPIFLMTFANIYLVGKIYQKLFPLEDASKARWIMLGSLPLMVYGTVIMFDFGLSLLTQLSILCLLLFIERQKTRWMVLMGVCMGFGVLMKGPVAYLYVLPTVLLAPFWAEHVLNKTRYFLKVLMAILVSAIPVLFWLIPVLSQSDSQFAFWLVWNQTAGRVTGNFSEAHVEPIYYYLMYFPLFLLPWVFFPSFWRGIKNIKLSKPLIFLITLIIPAFIAFSIISGKKIHYLIPLVPFISMLIAYKFSSVSKRHIVMASLAMVFLFLGAHGLAKNYVFHKYDLEPMAQEVAKHQGKAIGFIRNYQAEFGFLGRLTHPLESIDNLHIPEWLEKNPQGLIIIRYSTPDEIIGLKSIMDMEYRGRRLGIFVKR